MKIINKIINFFRQTGVNKNSFIIGANIICFFERFGLVLVAYFKSKILESSLYSVCEVVFDGIKMGYSEKKVDLKVFIFIYKNYVIYIVSCMMYIILYLSNPEEIYAITTNQQKKVDILAALATIYPREEEYCMNKILEITRYEPIRIQNRFIKLNVEYSSYNSEISRQTSIILEDISNYQPIIDLPSNIAINLTKENKKILFRFYREVEKIRSFAAQGTESPYFYVFRTHLPENATLDQFKHIFYFRVIAQYLASTIDLSDTMNIQHCLWYRDGLRLRSWNNIFVQTYYYNNNSWLFQIRADIMDFLGLTKLNQSIFTWRYTYYYPWPRSPYVGWEKWYSDWEKTVFSNVFSKLENDIERTQIILKGMDEECRANNFLNHGPVAKYNLVAKESLDIAAEFVKGKKNPVWFFYGYYDVIQNYNHYKQIMINNYPIAFNKATNGARIPLCPIKDLDYNIMSEIYFKYYIIPKEVMNESKLAKAMTNYAAHLEEEGKLHIELQIRNREEIVLLLGC